MKSYILISYVAIISTLFVTSNCQLGNSSQIVEFGLNFLASLIGGNKTVEEAEHTLIWKTQQYDEREYPSLNWVCGPQKKIILGVAWDHFMIKHLQYYFKGANVERKRMELTIPISIEYDKYSNNSEYLRTCMFIGKEFQDSPPVPKSKELKIVKREPVEIFTRKFDGYPKLTSDWITEAKKLQLLVEEEGEEILMKRMFWNVYDDIWKFWSRRNEVWLMRNNEV